MKELDVNLTHTEVNQLRGLIDWYHEHINYDDLPKALLDAAEKLDATHQVFVQLKKV